VLVSEFLHQFVTILSIKVGQWLGALQSIFVLGLFSHETPDLLFEAKRYGHYQLCHDCSHFRVLYAAFD
jgi:hypothetical protein